MIQDNSPTAKVLEGGGTPAGALSQVDRTLDRIKDLVFELYKAAPFDLKDKKRLKALVQQAFDFLHDLDKTCVEIQRERREAWERDAEARARAEATNTKLPDAVALNEAARYITGEKRTARALPKFMKFLHYEARLAQAPVAKILPNLPPEKEHDIDLTLENWSQEGIRRSYVIQLRLLFQKLWPLIKVESNRPKLRKRKRRARLPRDSDTKKTITAVIQEQIELT